MRKSSQGKMLKRGREQQQGNQRTQEFEKGRAGRKRKNCRDVQLGWFLSLSTTDIVD